MQHKKTFIPPELEHVFDGSTEQLLNAVSERFTISFEPWQNEFWEVKTRENKATIYFAINDLNAAALAHELLHLWLKQFDFLSMNHFYLLNLEDDFWGEVWNKNLCDHVGNCMAHLKIYPRYLEMGYAPDSFIQDAHKPQATPQGIKPIYLKRNGRLSARDTELFIADLIAIYACAFGHDYTTQLKLLKEKDKDLFEIVTTFWDSWKNFELSHENNDTQPLYHNFMEQLEKWQVTKIN